MKPKRCVLLFLQFISINFVFSSNITIATDDHYIDLINFSDNDTQFYINNSSNNTSFAYIKESGDSFKLSFLENNTFIYFDNNDLNIDCKNSTLDPEIFITYNLNNLYLKLNENLDWGFKLHFPSTDGYYFNLELANYSVANYGISIQQNKNLNTTFETKSYITTFGYKTNHHNIFFDMSSKTFELIPEIKKKSLNFIAKSDKNFNISLGYNYDNTRHKFYSYYEYTSLALKNNEIIGLDFNNLFSYINTPNEILINTIHLKYINQYFEISSTHKMYNIGTTEGYIETKPIIYGPFVFRKYNFNIYPFNLYTSEIGYMHKIKSIIGKTEIGLQYLRIYSDTINYTYNYKDLIWAFLKLETVYSSDKYYDNTKYNHLNLIDLSIMHNIEVNGFTIYCSVNQKLPFFDESLNINKLSSSIKSSSSSSESKRKFSGGTFINLGISFIL